MFYFHRNKELLRRTYHRTICLFLGIFVTWWLMPLYSSATPASSAILKDFNRLLISISSDSISYQISGLQQFIRDHPDFESAYLLLLQRYTYAGKTPEAESFFRMLADSTGSNRNGVWMLAKINSNNNQISTAYKFYRQALSLDKVSYPLIADFFEFKYKQSEQSNDSALFQNPLISNEERLIISAISDYKRSNYNKSIEKFAELPNNNPDHPFLLQIYGDCYFHLSNYQQADSLWKLGLNFSRQTGDLQFEATFLNNLGNSARKEERHNLAFSYFDSAYAAANRIGDFELIQQISGDYAAALRFQGKFIDALPLQKRSIEFSRKLQLYHQLANQYFSYAQSLYNLGRYNAALVAYDSSKYNALKLPDRQKLLIQIEYCQGDIYKNMNQFALAKNLYENAFHVSKRGDFKDLMERSQRKLADLMLSAGKNEAAINIYREFERNTTNLQRKCYINSQIAVAYIKENKYPLAKIYSQKALEFAKQAAYKQYIGWCISTLADVDVLLGNTAEAIREYTDALEIANEIAKNENNPDLLIEVHRGFGDAYRKSRDLENAIASYKTAALLVEESRKKLKVEQFRIGYFSSASQIYNNLVGCYYSLLQSQWKPAYYDTLFYYLEMARGRSIKDIEFRGESAEAQLQKDRAYVDYQQLCDRLRAQQRSLREYANNPYAKANWDSLYSNLEITRYTLMDQRLRLIEKEPPTAGERQQPPISLANIMKQLKVENAGLLLYNIDKAASFVLATAGSTVKAIPLPADQKKLQLTVKDLVDPFHHIDTASNPQIIFRAELAYELYKQLIKPVEDSLALPQRLVIVPDISIMGLPFEMLLFEAPDKTEYTLTDEPDYADNFILQRYSIIYAPTTALLLQNSKIRSAHPQILVFSNPFDSSPSIAQTSGTRQINSRGRWRFDPLPFAEKEADQIRKIYPKSKVYKRNDATKAAFLKETPEYEIIHVATHGIVDSTFDAFSGLVLAPSDNPNDDGFLMGYELADRKIDCDLITLSACETGLGKKVAGEGVLGLPRLFLNAGAKTVMMTLWKVDDQFAARIMPEFYNYYINERLSKADALRQAKLNIINSNQQNLNIYKHPFYWASFALYGAHDSNNFSSAFISSFKIYIIVIMLFSVILAAGYYYLKKKQRKSI